MAMKNASTVPHVHSDSVFWARDLPPSKIVCVGLNFRDNARESKMEIPKEALSFFKTTTSLAGPNDDLAIPKNVQKVDWEVELGVVIGKKGAYIEPQEALNVAGYILHSDYSEREFQLERGK